jgi:AraC-like DNA-binding protein
VADIRASVRRVRPVGERDLVYRTLPGGGVVGCGYIAKPDAQAVQVAFTAQDRYSAVLLLTGDGAYRDDDVARHLVPGDLVHRLPERPHWTVPGADGLWREFFLLLPPSWADSLRSAGLPLVTEPVWHPGLERRLVAELVAFLPALRAAADPELPRICLAMAAWIERAWRAHRTGSGAEEARLATARHLLVADLARPIDMGRVARELGLPPDAFRHWFAAATGCPPGAFRLRARLDQACLLLASTTLSIAAVAAATGFSDRYAFTRRFTVGVGVPPARFRRQQAG